MVMKLITLIGAMFLMAIAAYAQTPNKNYDSVLAKKLNANDNGMKQYYLVILKTGTSGITDKPTLDSLFRGHMKNIQKLASENHLVVAGPIGKNDKNYRGIFVLNTASKEEAEKWFKQTLQFRLKCSMLNIIHGLQALHCRKL